MKTRWCMAMVVTALVSACTPIDGDSSDPAVPAVVPDAVGKAEIPTRADLPDPELATQGVLTVEVRPRFGRVLAGKAGTLDLLVRLQAAEVEGSARPPLDLALVLDRSGSMSGDKLSSVKQAALETFNQLADDDRITFISYASDVEEHTHRRLARSSAPARTAALSLASGGGTALGPALDRALQSLGSAARSEDVLAHVMLLSDGNANEGEDRPEVLAEWAAKGFARGVAVSTLGVGVDYNEDLMTKLADAGGGRYHFIEDSDRVPEVVRMEFEGLTSTVASGITLAVAPGPDQEVVDIPGYAQSHEARSVVARVGSLSSGRRREMLVRLQYGAVVGPSMELGVFTVHFADATANGAEREIVVRPRVEVTDDPAQVEVSEDYAVTVRAFEMDVAAAMQAASEAVDSGSYDQARSLLRTKQAELQRRSEQQPELGLDAMVDELREAAEKIEDAEKDVYQRKAYGKGMKSKAYLKKKK